MDYNFFKRLFTKYSYQVDAPELKTFGAVRPKHPLVGVKKRSYSRKNSIWGWHFAGTGDKDRGIHYIKQKGSGKGRISHR